MVEEAETLGIAIKATAIRSSQTQALQNPLIREYTLSHIKDPTII